MFLVPWIESLELLFVIFSSLSKVSALINKEIRRPTNFAGLGEIGYHLHHSIDEGPDRVERKKVSRD